MSSSSMTTTTTLHWPSTHVRLRRRQRRLSTPSSSRSAPLNICQHLPRSLEPLDLSASSPTHTLVSLRILILQCLAELESRLSLLASPDLDAWKAKGELKMEEARQWARTALEMLQSIRSDVCSHLPDIHWQLGDLSVDNLINSFPDIPDVPVLQEMRSHLPDIPSLPDIPDVSRLLDLRPLPDMSMPHLPDLADMRSKLQHMRTRLHEFDFQKPSSYIPTLSLRLQSLHSHLTSVRFPGVPDMAPSTMLSDLIDSLLSSELVSEILDTAQEVKETEAGLEKAAIDIANAVKRSFEGVKLISYADLPRQWRNNPFVTHGYRFIPLDKWPLILMSVFTFHNETLNIHTHLIPFLLWGAKSYPFVNSSAFVDTPELVFMIFALVCLLCSTVWHTMSGCADHKSMDFCARVDYVGIGWLISASVATVVHYGFQCHPHIGRPYLLLCLLTAVAGNIFPFMTWFNTREYRGWRIAFFVSMAFMAIAPLTNLAFMHSAWEVFVFMRPEIHSLAFYAVGLTFYAAHIPERFIPVRCTKYLDSFGLGSHCIWHCFIVLAVNQHRIAIGAMRKGIECLC